MDIRLVLAIGLLGLAACGGSTNETPPSAEAPSTHPQTIPPEPPPAPRTAIVFIGDSITAGWPFPDYVVNAGWSGQKSTEMLERFQTDVLDKKPLVVHILAGTNDIRYVPDANVDAIARMAELASHDGACVVIGTIPPIVGWETDTRYTTAEGNARVLRWNDDIRALTRAYGYRLADYYPLFLLPDGTRNESLYWSVGNVHPGDTGHAAMWTLVQPMLHCP